MMNAHGSAIDHNCVHVVRIGHRFHDPVPVPRVSPPVEAVAERGWWAVFAGQIRPVDARAQDVENPVDDPPVINPFDVA